MKYYIEITLIPGADFSSYFLWEKVYDKIHSSLSNIKNKEGEVPVGVAFPEYKGNKNFLGNKLRIFAAEESLLDKTDIRRHLSSFVDYVHITGIRRVPDNVSGYSSYKRVQPKSNTERLARRRAKRQGISFEEALLHFENFSEERVKLPYINMSSSSTSQRFKMFIGKADSLQPVNKGFNCYGLSSKSTVPEF